MVEFLVFWSSASGPCQQHMGDTTGRAGGPKMKSVDAPLVGFKAVLSFYFKIFQLFKRKVLSDHLSGESFEFRCQKNIASTRD
jgi:hypothetical protein